MGVSRSSFLCLQLSEHFCQCVLLTELHSKDGVYREHAYTEYTLGDRYVE